MILLVALGRDTVLRTLVELSLQVQIMLCNEHSFGELEASRPVVVYTQFE